MQIYGPFRLSTTQGPASTQAAGAAKANRLSGDQLTTQSASQPIDTLDLSSAAREASAASATNRLEGNSAIAGGGEIRIDRVAQLRREIAEGSYETPEKLDAALDRLLDDLV